MSGGHFDYLYYRIEDTYKGEMQDGELNEMLVDFCKLLHDLEWWQSGDYGEETYRKSVKTFKTKWFGQTQEERLEKAIKEATSKFEKQLRDTFGIKE